VILCDHVKNLHWQARQASFVEHAPDMVVATVLRKLKTLINAV
jgi:mRNA-degrading endonuclease toxin of MazEF toxin-antitoxin module